MTVFLAEVVRRCGRPADAVTLARDHPTVLRADLVRAAFTEARREAPQTLPGAWEVVTTQPYPGENAPS